MRTAGWTRALLLASALGLVLAGLVPLANVLTGGTAVPWWHLAVREWAVRGLVLLSIALLASILLGPRLDAATRWAATTLSRPSARTFAVVAATLAGAAAAFLAWYCFAGRPFTSDEMAQQWHARILLAGRWFALAEPQAEFFNTAPVWDRDGRWFSQYPVGGPAFVAPGLAVGAAWLVNPLLLAFATWHLHGLVRRIAGDITARVTTLLFVVSPMVLIMAASQMNHVPALALALVALHAAARWDQWAGAGVPWRDAVVIGGALGVMATVRPLDAALVALTIGGLQMARAGRDARRWTSLALQVLAAAIPVAVLLWANARTTGAPLTFAYDALNGPAHAIGFHEDPTGALHTPRRGLVIASGYLLRLNRYLFEWPLPALLFVIAGLFVVQRAPSRWDLLLALLAIGFTVAYGAYWFDGFFSGPRFLFTAVPAFIYFVARAARWIPDIGHPRVRRVALLVIPLCVLTAWMGPWGVSSAWGRVALYRDQRTKLKTDVVAQVQRAGLTNALVFVNEGWRGRLQARLRVLGASQFRAERMVSTLDACALSDALDDADRLRNMSPAARLELVARRARSHGEARPVPGLPADQVVAIVPGSQPSAACLDQYRADTLGTMPYPPFLPLHDVGPDGRIAGSVIFARDLGAANSRLAERFGARAWYRYRPAAGLGDTAAFLPYRP